MQVVADQDRPAAELPTSPGSSRFHWATPVATAANGAELAADVEDVTGDGQGTHRVTVVVVAYVGAQLAPTLSLV